jgi:hypothetical protein
MVVGVFDLRSALAVAAAIIPFIFIADAIFSVIMTFIFLQPILDVLQAAGGAVTTAAKGLLERTKRWNFAGLILTVVSSTALYLHVVAFFVLSVLQQYSLHSRQQRVREPPRLCHLGNDSAVWHTYNVSQSASTTYILGKASNVPTI